ncbi:MAG: L-seryl-tRNA(Sec) selenium transferase, partial [Limisphaerales bacterium]
MSNQHQNRAYPSVESLRQELGDCPLSRPLLVHVIRREVERMKRTGEAVEREQVVARVRASVDTLSQARLRPVINATGIIVHTNLGRSPLGQSAIDALGQIAGAYNNLEYDLAAGERGGRAAYLEAGLATLCEAEAATLVNNCAAALVLALKEFTRDRPEVIVSRGELIQIGGGFRIPEILESSGAKLREVGTTNQTSLADYENAIGDQTGLILKVHRSNFFMDGFVASPTRSELSRLAREREVPLLEDLGSGALYDTSKLAGLAHEPTPGEVIGG